MGHCEYMQYFRTTDFAFIIFCNHHVLASAQRCWFNFHALLNLTRLTFLGSILSVVVISFTNISTNVRGGKHSLIAARSSICCTVSEDLSSSIYPTIFTACLVILHPGPIELF